MKLIVANLKMKLLYNDIEKYINFINNLNLNKVQLIICPTSIYANMFKKITAKNIYIGSQYVSPYENNNYTGEVSSKQLKSIGIKYCIVGHMDSMVINHETAYQIVTKINNLDKNCITPILCIGKEKNDDELAKQLFDIIPMVNNKENLVIAYEPYNAIGREKLPDVLEIINSVKYIKKLLYTEFNLKCKVIYGGSVNEKNCSKILINDIIDGVIVGTVGANMNKFKQLINEVENL